ncbi:hypothetical protein [Mucilaginibacter ginkgonis]|uniref:Colicin import membrane protein n=1 Tax=Mucilaginibacter ginkgonis TaxID=2682091 RepID=A0A6I4HVN0_9SPHI|nr:hypothetical protein [Mucilaginibacter ginkgonis]QQL49843.1 hypothetical protein GO620_017015 [Mucilaginibacter ginkgonis]
MKKLFKPVLFAAALFGATQVHAQSGIKKAAKNVGHATSKAAKDVAHSTSDAAKDVGHAGKKTGQKTAEIASKGASAVADKRFDGKYGPGGEKIYINSDAKYYYVNKKGEHVFVTKEQLRDNPPM